MFDSHVLRFRTRLCLHPFGNPDIYIYIHALAKKTTTCTHRYPYVYMMMMMEIAYPSIVMDDWRLSVWFNSKGWGEVENEGGRVCVHGFFCFLLVDHTYTLPYYFYIQPCYFYIQPLTLLLLLTTHFFSSFHNLAHFENLICTRYVEKKKKFSDQSA